MRTCTSTFYQNGLPFYFVTTYTLNVEQTNELGQYIDAREEFSKYLKNPSSFWPKRSKETALRILIGFELEIVCRVQYKMALTTSL